MKRTLSWLIAAGAVTSLLMLGLVPKKHRILGLVSSVHAQEGCSLATLQGEYLVTGGAEPLLEQRDDLSYPRRVVTVWNFDGRGGLTGFSIMNQGGTINRANLTGTYTMDSDRCVATLTFAAGQQWDIVITRDGSEGAAIRVDIDKETGRTENVGTRYIKKR